MSGITHFVENDFVENDFIESNKVESHKVESHKVESHKVESHKVESHKVDRNFYKPSLRGKIRPIRTFKIWLKHFFESPKTEKYLIDRFNKNNFVKNQNPQSMGSFWWSYHSKIHT